MRKKIGQDGIEAVFFIPRRIGRKDVQRTISYKGFWMIQQSGKFVKIRVPLIRFPSFRENLIGNRTGILIIFRS